MNPLLTGLLLYQGAKLVKGSKTADRLEYFPQRLDYKDKKFYLLMDILNPTNNSLKVDSFFGGVYIGEDKIGSIEYGTPVTLEKNKRTTVRYPIIPIGSGFGKVAARIIKGTAKDLQFKVIGVARALGLNNPVNDTIGLN